MQASSLAPLAFLLFVPITADDDTLINTVETMLGATTDVATGASELFVAMSKMEPITGATVGVILQVAKWFVALWKNLDPPTSDEEKAITRMGEGLRSQIKSATRELKNEIAFLKVHESMVPYTEEVIKPLSTFNDLFNLLTTQTITEDLVGLYRDTCSSPDKSGSGILKHINVYWRENCQGEDVEITSMISFNASRVLDKLAGSIKQGSVWSWKRFAEATTRARIALAYMDDNEAHKVLSKLQRRVSDRSFESVESAVDMLERTVTLERDNIKPCIPREVIVASNYTTFPVVESVRMVLLHIRQAIFHGVFCAHVLAPTEADVKWRIVLLKDRAVSALTYIASYVPDALDTVFPNETKILVKELVGDQSYPIDNSTYQQLASTIWDNIRKYGRPEYSYRVVVSTVESNYDHFSYCPTTRECFDFSSGSVWVFVTRYNKTNSDVLHRSMRTTKWYSTHYDRIGRILKARYWTWFPEEELFKPLRKLQAYNHFRYRSFHMVRTWLWDGPLPIFLAVFPVTDDETDTYSVYPYYYNAHFEPFHKYYNINFFFCI